MQKLGVNEIREKFLKFFESKGCLRVDSFSLVPKNDASLLLINSGMAPLKPWFTGAEVPPRKRVTTCQKCIRTPDIERVGHTARHGTFFEMLGNFSFGDYFKREAITWAWEFFTKEMQIPVDDIWITVYEEDDEARDIWVNEVGVAPERVVKMGKEDNFWEHGTGPCGPCSEIHIDRGEAFGCGKPDCKLGCDCDRFMEVWNLVFTQFDKDENGNYNRLPNPNIDTGMGLERLAVIMQGVDNLFEVDTVQDVMKHICRIADVTYKQDEKTDVSLRVITDHIRSTVMMVSDGVIPSNEGRGYVLRRLLRRAARHGKLLGIGHPFLYEVADTVIAASESAYPELAEKREYIKNIVKKEEERFDATIDNGLVVLNDYIAKAKESGRTELTGEEAFKLHDTYGFPLDLTIEIAGESGLSVDTEGFAREMQAQKDTARAARKDGSSWDAEQTYQFENAEPTVFVGYDTLEAEATVVGIVVEDEGISKTISAEQTGFIVTDKTPFYAEMGGQVGDVGAVLVNGTTVGTVVNTTKTGDGYYMHEVTMCEGEVNEGDTVTLCVDKAARMAVCRNHTATHILDKALRDVLGSHVAQAGSLVAADRLRFDFSHFEAMTAEQLQKTEDIVNQKILESIDVSVQELPIEEAKKLGAIALFGEKYGDVVRVVSVGDYSVEFCGGTHLTNSAQCGLFKIISEGGVAAGVRRIEAVTGQGVLDYIAHKDEIVAKTAEILRTNEHELAQKAESVMFDMKQSQKQIEAFEAKMASLRAKDVMAGHKTVNGIDVVCAQADGASADALKAMADDIKAKNPNAVVVLASKYEDKITFVAMAGKDALAKGVHAGKIIKDITAVAGGKGGGKPDMAQGGGKDESKIDDALARVDDLIMEQTK